MDGMEKNWQQSRRGIASKMEMMPLMEAADEGITERVIKLINVI